MICIAITASNRRCVPFAVRLGKYLKIQIMVFGAMLAKSFLIRKYKNRANILVFTRFVLRYKSL